MRTGPLVSETLVHSPTASSLGVLEARCPSSSVFHCVHCDSGSLHSLGGVYILLLLNCTQFILVQRLGGGESAFDMRCGF